MVIRTEHSAVKAAAGASDMSGAILIDWGSTNARAFLVNSSGAVTDRRHAPTGIRTVTPGGFPAALDRLLGPWSPEGDGGEKPPVILMSGMVGSRQGWTEAPYCPCPARIEDLAAGLCPVPDRPGAWIVPGVHRADAQGRHDVMRGEEVQLFGAVAEEPGQDRVLCMPGTHSKWALYRGGSLADFATAMTGEAFQALRDHTLLGAVMQARLEGSGLDGTSLDAFRRGIDRAEDAGGLLHHLFGVRAEGLFGSIPAAGLEAYLSGILIGHEIRSMAKLFASAAPILLVAAQPLARHYALAFERLGQDFAPVDAEQATLRGLTQILETAAPQLSKTLS